MSKSISSLVAIFGCASVFVVFNGCSSTSSNGSGANPAPTENCAEAAGPAPKTLTASAAAVATGASTPADTHCGSTTVTVDATECSSTAGSGGSDDSAGGAAGAGGSNESVGGIGGAAGGTGGANAVPTNANGDCTNTDTAYGDIAYGSESDDDDCKYHVSWTASPIAQNQDVTFTVTAVYKDSGDPVRCANPRAEVFFPCDPSHVPPSQDFSSMATETAPGTYTIGADQFDKSGRWAVRFHLFESCFDQPASPHGHAAFYFDVP